MPSFRLFRFLAAVPLWIGLISTTPAGPLQVVVAVPPQQYLVERVGGDRVEVEVLLPPGRGPETFEISPKQIMQLAEADLFCCIGVAFEKQCLDRLTFEKSELHVLHMADGLPRLPGHHHHHHGEAHHHAEAQPDPHVWTSPILLQKMTTRLANELSELDPSQAAAFHERAGILNRELQQAHDDLVRTFTNTRSKTFLVVHPAWSYFANDFGLQQLAIEKDGKSPGPRRLAELIDHAKRLGLNTVFSERQFSSKDAEVIAREIGGRVVTLDPLATDVIGNLRTVGSALAESMR